MAFAVFPNEPGNVQDHPLQIAAGANSGLKTVGPLPATGTKFIRVTMVGAGSQPGIALKADPDPMVPATTIAADGFYHTVFTGGSDAGDCLVEPTGGVLRITIVLSTAVMWQLQITNTDAAPHGFTWVIADSDAEAQQPWLHSPSVGSFNVLSGQADTFAITVSNNGTGPANLVAGVAPGPGFVVTTVPPPIAPNGTGDLIITYTGAAAPGSVAPIYAVTATLADTTAHPLSAGHNTQVTLTAITRQIEAVFLVDASGSMAYTPQGTSAPFPDQARWAKLKAGAAQSWGLLLGFAGGKGRFGVAQFPDISTGVVPAPSPSSKVLLASGDITDANVTAAQNALGAHTPVEHGGATPMGHGLGAAMGTVAGNFGLFLSTANARDFNERFLILQSDGANNSPTPPTPPQPSQFYPPGSAAGTSFVDKKIKVIAVGYGKEGTPFEVDNNLLKALAMNSVDNGYFLDAFADDTGLALRKQFRQAIVDGLHLDPTVDPHGFLSTARPEARHEVTVLPFDTKVAFVVDWVTRSAPIRVSLVTPLCEVITEQSAANTPGVFFRTDAFHRMFIFDETFLRNTAAPTRPRYGAWTLIIDYTGAGVDGSVANEEYQYEVITQSRLKMKVQFDKSLYGTGDRIGISATITLDGKAIPNASVMLEVTAPGQSAHNFIARTAVSAGLIERAQSVLRQEDVTAIGIKSFAIGLKGAKFNAFTNNRTIRMSDSDNTGVYSASIDDTSVPGNYEFYVVAVGLTEGGTAFRREQRVSERVDVLPRPNFTLIDVDYQVGRATVRVGPSDKFGNVVLFDPAFNPRISLQATGGEFIGPLSFNGDGSYTGTLVYSPTSNPVIRVLVDGAVVVPSFPLAPVTKLVWVDEGLDFHPGNEAKPGINTHNKPEAALGDPNTKPADIFVSLGGRGSLTVAVKGSVIVKQGPADVTVFVARDESLRPYLVEASADGKSNWTALGTSPGITQSFGLGKLTQARAIRVTDQSGRIRDNDQTPLSSPGISVRGIGVAKVTGGTGTSGALDDEVGAIVGVLADGTEYRQVLKNPSDGQQHVTPDGRRWIAVHESVVNGQVVTSPFTIHWRLIR